MTPHERMWLLGTAAIAAASLMLAVFTGQRWIEAQRKLDAGTGVLPAAEPPSEAAWAAVQARLAAGRNRLPAAGTPASRQAQQAFLELVQRQGMEVGDVMPKPASELGKAAMPGCPGWPAVVMELRGKATFAAVNGILAGLPSLGTTVLPLEIELVRGGTAPARTVPSDPESPAPPSSTEPADRRIQVRLVVAL